MMSSRNSTYNPNCASKHPLLDYRPKPHLSSFNSPIKYRPQIRSVIYTPCLDRLRFRDGDKASRSNMQNGSSHEQEIACIGKVETSGQNGNRKNRNIQDNISVQTEEYSQKPTKSSVLYQETEGRRTSNILPSEL